MRMGIPTWVDAQGNFIPAIDPEMTGSDGSKPNVTSTFFRYADDHGQANDYLRRASRVSMLFVVNHLIGCRRCCHLCQDAQQPPPGECADEQGVGGEVQPVASLRLKL